MSILIRSNEILFKMRRISFSGWFLFIILIRDDSVKDRHDKDLHTQIDRQLICTVVTLSSYFGHH